MRLNNIASLAFLFGLVLSVNALDAQSLSEVVDLALENSNRIKAQKQSLSRTESEYVSTKRSTLPQLLWSSSYRHVTDVPQIDFPTIPGVPERSVSLGVYDTYENGLTAHYVLFSGFAQRNQVRMKKRQHTLSRNQLNKSQREVALQTIQLYRKAQLQKLNQKIIRSAQERVALQLKRLRALVREGMALEVDTLALQMAKLQYEQKRIALQTDRQVTLQQLKNLTGKTVEIAAFEGIQTSQQPSALTLEASHDLKRIDSQRQIMERSRALARSEYFPKITLQAGARYGKPGLDMIDNEWMAYGVFGVSMEWNLFKWGADRKAVEARTAAIKELDFQERALQDQIKTNYENAVGEWKALRKQLQVAETAQALARKRMKVLESQFKQGNVSATDYNEANLELSEAELQYTQQRIQLAMKLHEIDYISGKPMKEWRME